MNNLLKITCISAITFITIAFLVFFPLNIFFFYISFCLVVISAITYYKKRTHERNILIVLCFSLLLGFSFTEFDNEEETAAIFSVDKNQNVGTWIELESPIRIPDLNTSFISYQRNIFSLEENEISFNVTFFSSIQCDAVAVIVYVDDDKMISSIENDDHIFVTEENKKEGQKIQLNGESMWKYETVVNVPVRLEDIDPYFIHFEFFFHFSERELYQGRFIVDINFIETGIESEGCFSTTTTPDPNFKKLMETSIGRLMMYAIFILLLYGMLLSLSVILRSGKPLLKMQVVYSIFSLFLLVITIISVPEDYAEFKDGLYIWCDENLWFSKAVREIGYTISDVLVYIVAIDSWVITVGLAVYIMTKMSLHIFGSETGSEALGEMIK